MPYPIKLELDAMGYPAYYKVGQLQTQVLAGDMCHFMYTNPNSYYFGQAPLQAAGKAIDVDNAAQAWQKISMQNRGTPDFMISFNSEEMTQEQYEQATARIKEKTGPGSAREPLVTSKATVQQLSLSPVEMDFMETRRFSREEACSVYGVPSALIAEMGKVNLANAETARKLFWLDTVIPLLDELVANLNRTLAKEHGDNVRITYDTTNVAALQVNYAERMLNAKALWSMGVPFNDINQRLKLGFDDIENGDIGYIPSGVIPSSFDVEEEVPEEVKNEVRARILKNANNG
jgi:HK97 family phage portal protein